MLHKMNKNAKKPGKPTKGKGRPAAPGVRLSIEAAGREFHVDRRALTARLREAEQEAGEDKKFAIHQVHEALAGSLHSERVKKVRVERELLEMEAAERRKGLVDTEVVDTQLESCIRQVIGTISGCKLIPWEWKAALFDDAMDNWTSDLERSLGLPEGSLKRAHQASEEMRQDYEKAKNGS